MHHQFSKRDPFHVPFAPPLYVGALRVKTGEWNDGQGNGFDAGA